MTTQAQVNAAQKYFTAQEAIAETVMQNTISQKVSGKGARAINEANRKAAWVVYYASIRTAEDEAAAMQGIA